MKRQVVLLSALLSLLVAVASGFESGSGSADCFSALCTHECDDSSGSPVCSCYTGYTLAEDRCTCEECRGGYWGIDCQNRCECNVDGNGCDNVNGTCLCNSCWDGDNCTSPVGSDCFLMFLQIPNKNAADLENQYGGAAIPLPPDATLVGLVTSLMDLSDSTVIDISSVNLDILNRTDVGQGPLARLSYRVLSSNDRPRAEQGLVAIETKVKVGDVRATLIIQPQEDTTEVTLNAGTSA